MGKTTAGENVTIARASNVDIEDLPCINIYTIGEAINRHDEAPKTYKRGMDLVIECVTTGDDDDDADLKAEIMSELVEDLMEQDEELGGFGDRLELTATDYRNEPDAQSPVQKIALVYRIDFISETRPVDPKCLADFKGVNTDWQIGHDNAHPDGVVDARDEYKVREEEDE